MITQAIGKQTGMEKRNMSTIFRTSIVLAVFVLSGITAQAQVLVDGGFETPVGTNYICCPPTPVTNPAVVGWAQFGSGYITGTNNPPDANNSGSPITVHAGGFALKAYSPGGWNGSGAFQLITNNVIPGQQLALTGWGLNWSGDPFTNLTGTAQQFGFIQIQFKNSSGANIGGGFDSPNMYPTNMPLDTWISTSVTGTAPVGASQVLIQVLVVGFGATSGSLFFDDLGLANLNAPIVTNIFHDTIIAGNQICWGTITTATYQAQSSPDSNTWTNVGGLIAGDGNTNCTFDAGRYTNHKFYRVLQMQ
jgi:dihydroxyacetone kinase DhaKLM complex PTS-EIIA-like component DhaM